jgi:uncharacterized protein YkwD
LPPPPPPPPPPDPPGSPDPPDKPKPPRPADPTGRPERRDAFGCAYAANRAGEFHDVILERAAICAINHQRRRRGLRPLRHDPDLHEAAARHAKDMVVRRYFSHVSPRGRTSRDRVERAGYLAGAEFWTLAEVLAWQQAPAGSPADTVRAWMRSRPHRKALLLPSLRDVGVAIVHGTPAGGRGGSTWAANMGRRG